MSAQLKESLHFMKMGELKEVCLRLALPATGKKAERIQRILTFLRSGKVSKSKNIPQISKAQRGRAYPLAPRTRILAGSYKNDAVTRAFMKKLVGSHFHFTAFGQDWIKQRWLQGKPPTYAEFAKFWQKEQTRRKNKKAAPKQEWAYLSFIQRFLRTYPDASRTQITKAWEIERKKHVHIVQDTLDKILAKA